MSDLEAIKKLLKLLKRYRKTIAVIICCLLISTGLNLCIPLISKQIMDDGFIGGNKKLLIDSAFLLLVIYGINSMTDII